MRAGRERRTGLGYWQFAVADPITSCDAARKFSCEVFMSAFKALMTVIYPVPDLSAAREWYAAALAVDPYFDQPFYVGFNVGGYELGLVPTEPPLHEAGNRGAVAYWGVDDADAALSRLVGYGARVLDPVKSVGGDIRVGIVEDPYGNAFGIIENPGFQPPPVR